MAPPKLTTEQAKQEARAAEESAPARAAAAQEAAEWSAQEDGRERQRRSARQLEESQLARILGNTSGRGISAGGVARCDALDVEVGDKRRSLRRPGDRG
jgi:hypothetical protein